MTNGNVTPASLPPATLPLASNDRIVIQQGANVRQAPVSAIEGGASPVASVFGREGSVTAQSGDYAANQIAGLGTIATQAANNVAITGGAVDGVSVGGVTPATGVVVAITNTSTANARDQLVNGQIVAAPPAGPAPPSEHVWIGGLFTATGLGAQANAGNSHIPALVGWYQQNSTATNLLGLGVEGKVEIFVAGRTITAYGVESQFLLDNAGSRITNAFGYNAEILLNNGVIDIYAGYRMGDLTGIPGITAKAFLYGQDPAAVSLIAAPVYGPAGYATFGTANELAPAFHPGYVTGRYYYGTTSRPVGFTPAPMTAGTIYYTPFFVASRTAFTKLGVHVTSGITGATLKLGIYKGASGVPTTLIGGTGDLASPTTGNPGDVEATIAATLEAGTYFMVVTASDAITVNAYTDLAASFTMGTGSSTGDDTFATKTGAYAPFPDPALPFTGYAAVGFLTIAIWLRK